MKSVVRVAVVVVVLFAAVVTCQSASVSGGEESSGEEGSAASGESQYQLLLKAHFMKQQLRSLKKMVPTLEQSILALQKRAGLNVTAANAKNDPKEVSRIAAETLLSAAQAVQGQEISAKIDMKEPLDQRIKHAMANAIGAAGEGAASAAAEGSAEASSSGASAEASESAASESAASAAKFRQIRSNVVADLKRKLGLK
eukprot:TRINITY_DN55608_c0_g1_i1.p4 TRINITY_DN55608_c0_g1~~TRINITY_DN55608_c0_g1_i1.p4  ORF type:complete len:215 (+),score=111.74 TRINITY_DN55608_c0_g1_i1:50-646(+)